MMKKIFNFLSGFFTKAKTYAVSAAIVIALAVASGLVIKHQYDKIIDLRADAIVLIDERDRLQNRIETQAKAHAEEVGRLNHSIGVYAESMKQREARISNLNKALKDIKDETVNKALSVDMPRDVAQRMFNDKSR